MSSILSRLSDQQFRILVIVINIGLIALVMRMRFCYQPDLPAKPPKPKSISAREAKRTVLNVDRNQKVYAEFLSRDSREVGVPVVSVKTMAKVIPYKQSRMQHKLFPGKGKKNFVEFAGLKLMLRVGDVPNTARPHLLLDIENTTDTHLAYRVETRPTKGKAPCAKKRDLGHNANAVAPKGVETRSECIYRNGWGLEIRSIEVMELNPLSYYYVSSVKPKSVGIEARLANGHVLKGGFKLCRQVLSARSRKALEVGQLQWRDLIDFYARHNCNTYNFPRRYQAWTEDFQTPLPAIKRL